MGPAGPAGADGQDGEVGQDGQDGAPGIDGDELFERIIIVNGDGTPTANGQALQDAINTANAATPTAADPWMIFLEPGTYTRELSGNIEPNITIAGSGLEATIIEGTSATPAFTAGGGNVTFRDLALAKVTLIGALVRVRALSSITPSAGS